MIGSIIIGGTTTLYLVASIAFLYQGKHGLAWMHLCYGLANLGVIGIAMGWLK